MPRSCNSATGATRSTLIPVLLVLVSLSSTAYARSDLELRAYAGVFNTDAWLDNTESDALEVGVEFYLSPLEDTRIAPLIGTAANADDASWLYTGVRWGHFLGAGWQAAFSFALTFYNEGDSKPLGSDLEFRSGVEMAYGLEGGHALGAQFYHISNAGISNSNPGNNSLVFFYSIPIRP